MADPLSVKQHGQKRIVNIEQHTYAIYINGLIYDQASPKQVPHFFKYIDFVDS